MKIILKSIRYRRFTPSGRQTSFTIIILCMGWKQLFLEMKKNVPWHILAERFLFHRTQFPMKKTADPDFLSPGCPNQQFFYVTALCNYITYTFTPYGMGNY